MLASNPATGIAATATGTPRCTLVEGVLLVIVMSQIAGLQIVLYCVSKCDQQLGLELY